MVGLEGMGGRAAGDGLHHRRFHFDKAALLQETAGSLDDGDAFAEDFARSGIRNQIEVSLPVFRFGILDSMPFFGQRTQGLGKHGQRLTRIVGSPVFVVNHSPSTPIQSPMSSCLKMAIAASPISLA